MGTDEGNGHGHGRRARARTTGMGTDDGHGHGHGDWRTGVRTETGVHAETDGVLFPALSHRLIVAESARGRPVDSRIAGQG